MAAADQTYRNQRTLDIVFGVSSVLMLVSVVVMFAQDYFRDYKIEQREFRDVESALAERQMINMVPEQSTLSLIKVTQEILGAALTIRDANDAEYRKKIEAQSTDKVKSYNNYQAVKADYDSQVSELNIAIEERNKQARGTPQYKHFEQLVQAKTKKVESLKNELSKALTADEKNEKKIKDLQQEQKDVLKQKLLDSDKFQNTLSGSRDVLINDYVEAQKSEASKDTDPDTLRDSPELKDALSRLDQLLNEVQAVLKSGAGNDKNPVETIEDELKRLTVDLERFAKLAVQKKWSLGDNIRRLPVLDAFASPIKIHQFTLTDLPIDYSFKFVTRFDRCMTCHQSIDRPAYTSVALWDLTQPLSKDMESRLKKAEKVYKQRREFLGKSLEESFDSSEISKLARPLSSSNLTWARVKEFSAHPRLDLFVEGNSHHPSEKFGCTICHAGQGSATDFFHASHSPNDSEQKKVWTKDNGWKSNHDWDFPMLPQRFMESSCLKCHHQVVDLLPEGNKVEYRETIKPVKNDKDEVVGVRERLKLEAPGAKVVRGYDLVRDFGCFGCHEISGVKGGRWVGPDLRLEPTPPPDELSPEERTKLYSDPVNPPGKMRKVGPSLRRINDKTNEEWVKKWINKPRDFRPDTKMPHFYNLSNNNKEYLAQNAPDQKDFPGAEINAIAFYLFQHSKEITDAKPLPKLAHDFKGDATKGRQLFTERGCLACHKHDKTEKAEAGIPAVISEAHFGPNLTRIADKLGDKPGDEKARHWLIQWIKDPTRHHPRTFMPVTHLSDEDAGHITTWLLEQKTGWKGEEVEGANGEVYQKLAQVYLTKNLTSFELEDIFKPENAGQLADQIQKQLDANDQELGKKLSKGEDKLKLYIGRKAINQLGCFGCHDIPGFEAAKPIGTPLNDWGKKDPDRIAFEDIGAYVEKTYFEGVKHGEDGKEHYETYFRDALAHHQREGFLQQKLREPRSYDYDRLRSWDERLRMPQFRFARGEATTKDDKESEDDARFRLEAEARESVMTFILGLIAEPIPSKFIYDPSPDKKAVVQGKKVLEKFNCAGCHQLRPGQFDFKVKPTEPGKKSEVLSSLVDQMGGHLIGPKDHVFPNHNAFVGEFSSDPSLLTAHGLPKARKENAQKLKAAIQAVRDAKSAEEKKQAESDLRTTLGELSVDFKLTQALRFLPEDAQRNIDEGKIPPKDVPGYREKQAKDIPAAETLGLPESQLAFESEVWGGRFADLLAPYLVARKAPNLEDDAKARTGLPPPLLREGERVQPDWLFRFLRNPYEIREIAILRMPRFNMSEEEAMALVHYFSAVDRLSNPRLGLEAPYFPFPQRQEGFLADKSAAYASTLKKEDLGRREDQLKNIWKEMLPDHEKEFDARIAVAKKAVDEDKAAEDKAKDNEKASAKAKREQAEKDLKNLQDELEDWKKLVAQPKAWKKDRIYATDAYRLLINYNDPPCLTCHKVANYGVATTGPRLEGVYERLRPDWTKMWIASPSRMIIYPEGLHPMVPNFPKGEKKVQDLFVGDPIDQITAVRDILMLYPKVADMPEDRKYRPTLSGAK